MLRGLLEDALDSYGGSLKSGVVQGLTAGKPAEKWKARLKNPTFDIRKMKKVSKNLIMKSDDETLKNLLKDNKLINSMRITKSGATVPDSSLYFNPYTNPSMYKDVMKSGETAREPAKEPVRRKIIRKTKPEPKAESKESQKIKDYRESIKELQEELAKKDKVLISGKAGDETYDLTNKKRSKISPGTTLTEKLLKILKTDRDILEEKLEEDKRRLELLLQDKPITYLSRGETDKRMKRIQEESSKMISQRLF